MISKILKKLLNINDQDDVKYLINDSDRSLTIFVKKNMKTRL